jgi:hypothetical protein
MSIDLPRYHSADTRLSLHINKRRQVLSVFVTVLHYGQKPEATLSGRWQGDCRLAYVDTARSASEGAIF